MKSGTSVTNFKKRLLAIILMVVVIGNNIPATVFAAPAVDVKVNGSDGPVTLNAGDTFTYSWTSTDVTACQQTSPVTSGVSTSGSSTAVGAGHPFYPTVGSSVTITITCTDGTISSTDSVTVNLAGTSGGSPTIDVKVNGSDGPVTLNSGDTYTYTWASTNATACQETSPVVSGVSLTGSSTAVGPGHPFYPSAGSPTTITITCTDGTTSISDSVVVSLVGGPGTVPTVDLKINGGDVPVTLNSGDTYVYSWTSANATACQQTSPVTSGISLNGTSTTISPGHPFYPSTTMPTTITVTCTDGTSNATDSLVVSLASVSTPPPTAPSVDVKVNGSDGPVTINSGSSYTYTWVSANATACQQTSPVTSGVSLSGTSTPVGPGHPFYPSTGSPTTITVTCTNGIANATDSVVVNLAGSTPPPTTLPTVDVKANGSDGPITIPQGSTYVYTWVSANATACQQTTPVISGVTINGTSTPVGPGHPFYPSVGSPTTITIVCTNGVANATDSVVINLAPSTSTPPPGGGGSSLPPPSIVIPGIPNAGCPLIRDYMRIDFNNNPAEVMKLQTFLRDRMGYTFVSVNGVFDQATYLAVGSFQNLYKSEILTPWGHTAPTYYVYMLTLKKINEIACNHSLALTQDQQHEIVAFRNLINRTGISSKAVGYAAPKKVAQADYGLKDGKVAVTDKTKTTSITVGTATSTPIASQSSALSATTTTPPILATTDKGQNKNNLAAALFTFPDTTKGKVQCVYELVLALIVLYILGVLMKDVLYSNVPENASKRFLAKWAAISVGTVVAIFLAYFLGEYCLIVPFLIALLISLVWMSFYDAKPVQVTANKPKAA